MKIKNHLITLIATLALAATLQAHEAKKAGPNGGKILTTVEPHAEFFVTAERKVQITFLDESGQAIAPTGQTVTVICGDRSNPTKLTFAKSGNSLVSEGMLPEGNDFPTVVQIKSTPEAKPVTEKFNLNLAECPSCKLKEYACTCEH